MKSNSHFLNPPVGEAGRALFCAPQPRLRDLLRGRLALIAGFAMLSLATSTPADVLHWDGGTSNIGTNGDGLCQGAAGTWSTSVQNWDQGAGLAEIMWNNSQNDDAYFGTTGIVAGAGVITLGAPITANSLTVTSTNYAFTDGGNSANTLTVNTVTNTATTSISNNIVNSGTFETHGGSTLTLLASSPGLTGAISIYSGTLVFGNQAVPGTPGPTSFGNVQVASNATFKIAANSAATYLQDISGQGSVSVQGSNFATVVTLAGNSTFSGNVQIGSCALQVNSIDESNPNALGQGTNVIIGNNSSAASLNYAGNGETTSRTLTLGGTTATVANTLVASGFGPLVWNGPVAFGTTNAHVLTLSGLSSSFNTFAGVIPDGIVSNTAVVKATASGASGSIWMLTGANTYSGGTTLNAGILLITNDSGLGVSTGRVTFLPSSGSTLMGTLESISNNVTLAPSRTIFMGGTNPGKFGVFDTNNLYVASYLTGTGAVQKASSSYALGAVRFSNDTNDFTGDFTAGFGNTEFTSVANQGTASSLGKGAAATGGKIILANSASFGVLRYVGAANSSTTRALNWTGTNGFALDASGNGTIAYLATAALKSGGGNNTLDLQGSNTGLNTLAQVISDNGGLTALTKSGAGKWVLTAANTYSGNTTISEGTLALSGASSLANTPKIIIDAGGTLDVSGLSGGYSLAASQSLLATNGATATVNGNLNVSSASVTMTNVPGTPTINVTGGALTLASGIPFTVNVNNSGTPLGTGTYKLISKGTGGSVAGTAPASVTVGGDGLSGGATVALSISGGELYLVVNGGGTLYPPVIHNFGFIGTSAVLSFSGTNGQTWRVLTSTNVAAPYYSWIAVASGTFSGSVVNYTNASTAEPKRFFRVACP
jgi:autotransporter-associated beta strand protein